MPKPSLRSQNLLRVLIGQALLCLCALSTACSPVLLGAVVGGVSAAGGGGGGGGGGGATNEPANRLGFVTQPSSTMAGQTLNPAVLVAILDDEDNVRTDIELTITLSLSSNPVGGNLSGTISQTTVNGIATFNDLRLFEAGISYSLAASAPDSATATSGFFNIAAGPAMRVRFRSQPVDTQFLLTIPPIDVAVEDQFGNLIESSTAAITINLQSNPGPSMITGNQQLNAVNGIARFTGLSLNTPAPGYTFIAGSPGLSSDISQPFEVLRILPERLRFTRQPTDALAGEAIAPAFRVSLEDSLGRLVQDDPRLITLTLSTNPSGSILSGTTIVQTVAGLADFADISLNLPGNGYVIQASSPGLISAQSASFNITTPPPTLLFSQQPSTAIAGQSISPSVEVSLVDQNSNILTSANDPVTISLVPNASGGTLSGTFTINAVNGIAEFPNLSIDRVASNYQLSANTPAANSAATSASFAITPAQASRLIFVTEPTGALTNSPFTPSVQVGIADSFGNLTTGNNSITINIDANPAGGVLSGTRSLNAVNGVASFLDLSIDQPGQPYTLRAESLGLATVTSAQFSIGSSALADINSISLPAGTLQGRIPVTYTVLQSAARPADILVEYSTGGGNFVRATLAGSPPGSGEDGVTGVTTAGTLPGASHIFVWDSLRDAPATGTVTLRVTAFVDGQPGQSQTRNLLVSNGLGFAANLTTSLQFGTFGLFGDFNKDGILDLVDLDRQGGTIELKIGNGDGTFGPSTSFPATANLLPLAAGDLNKDGNLDIVTGGGSQMSDLVVLLGNGQGQFAAPIDITTNMASFLRQIEIADFNKDGNLDLLVLSQESFPNTLNLYLGLGNGGFNNPMPINVSPNPSLGSIPDLMRVVDLDLDGDLDLVTKDQVISTILGNGDGTFATPVGLPLSFPPELLGVGDFNEDLFPDLIVRGSGTVSLMPGSSSGTFTTTSPIVNAFTANRLTIGDLNGDQHQDLVFSDSSVFLGLGNGQFQSPFMFGATGNPGETEILDFNRDGQNDLAVYDATLNVVNIKLNTQATDTEALFTSTVITSAISELCASGDVNNDGKPDLVIMGPNGNFDAATVFLSNGTNTFTKNAPINFPSIHPPALELADMNNDSNLDIVTADELQGNVFVLFGDGTGNFGPINTLQVGGRIKGLAIGRFNADILPDIAITDTINNQINLLIANGAGSFTVGTPINTPEPVSKIRSGDLNTDGRDDLVGIAENSGTVYSTLGQGQGNFAPLASLQTTNRSSDLALAKLDTGDVPDLILVDFVADGLSVRLGDGSGGFTAPSFSTVVQSDNPNVILPVKWNADDFVDVLVSTREGASIAVFLGDGQGQLRLDTLVPSVTGFRPPDLASADFNGDGKLDLAVAGNTHIRFGLGSGGFETEPQLPPQNPSSSLSARVLALDVNRDGLPDIVGLRSVDLVVRLNQGAGQFSNPMLTTIQTGLADLKAADLNHDGIVDLVIVVEFDNNAVIMLGNGLGLFSKAGIAAVPVGPKPQRVALGDINRDGHTDMVVSNGDSQNLSIALGVGDGSFQNSSTLNINGTTSSFPYLVVPHLVDLNNDGRLDIAVCQQIRNVVSIFLGNGNGTFTSSLEISVGAEPGDLASGDFNRDGNTDLIIGSEFSGALTLLIGNGNGTFQAPSQIPITTRLSRVRVRDLNRDARADIIALSAGNSQTFSSLNILLGQANANFSAPAAYGPETRPVDFDIADFDGDGKLDLLTANTANGHALILGR